MKRNKPNKKRDKELLKLRIQLKRGKEKGLTH